MGQKRYAVRAWTGNVAAGTMVLMPIELHSIDFVPGQELVDPS